MEEEEEEEEEKEAEGVVVTEWVLWLGRSPPTARPWRYGMTPAAETTTVALWVDAGTDSCPNSVRGDDKKAKKPKKQEEMKGEVSDNRKLKFKKQ